MTRKSTGDRARLQLAQLGSVPRDVRLTANGRTLIVFAVVFAAAAAVTAIVLPIVRHSQQTQRARLAAEATPAAASVIRVTTIEGEDPRDQLTYVYFAGGTSHENSVKLSRRAGRRFGVGSRLDILYARSEPARSWLPGREPDVMPLALVPLIPAALLVIGGLLTWPVRRERALLSEGRLAQARVLTVKKVQHQHHHGYRVRYEFTTLSGATATGTSDRGRKGTAPGDVIPVVYHRDNPRRNAPYPLSLVTPDRP
jgi:hypothetical protein